MDAAEALSARRSVRDYLGDALDPGALDRVLAAATAAPSAGFSQGLDLVVLETPAATASYWDVTLPAGPRRDRFAWPGLLRAPVLVVVVTHPEAYVARYAEDDKAASGLGHDTAAWPVPYWWVDAGAAIMAMLVAATAEGLGSLLFGLFGHEAAVGSRLGIPDDRRLVGTVALGHAAPGPRRPGRSSSRPRRALADVIHRGGW